MTRKKSHSSHHDHIAAQPTTVNEVWRHVPRTPLRIVAVDPGEAWCGIARLDIAPVFDRYMASSTRGIEFTLDARVISATERSMARVTAECLWPLPAPRPYVSTLVAEDYRVRPVGHASFHGGGTLRLLGALEYAAQSSQRMGWHLYPPREPDRDLPLLSNGALDGWIAQWHKPRDHRWHHARSAWRVLLQHLMTHHVNLLQYLRSPTIHQLLKVRKATFPLMDGQPNDLLAPEGVIVARSKSPKNTDLTEGLADSTEDV